jgi:hypothetical protein
MTCTTVIVRPLHSVLAYAARGGYNGGAGVVREVKPGGVTEAVGL